MLLVSLFSGFYIGMCTYIDTCVQDLSTFANEINKIVENEKSTENQGERDKLCSDMIQFHVDVLE